MMINILMDDSEEIVASDRQFRKVINDYGEDGIVWFNKKFIKNYVNSLHLKIERLEKALKECEKK